LQVGRFSRSALPRDETRDPNRGAQMPVVAIGAAALAWGAVATSTVAATSLIGVLEITAAVGATLGAVGVVTHDKTLTTAGLIIGGIGSIGSLAASAGLFGAEAGTTSLFGSSEAAAGGFPESIAVTPQIAGSNIGSVASASSGIVDSFGVADASNVLPTTAIEQQTGTASGLINRDFATGALASQTPSSTAASGSLGGLPQAVALNANPALAPAPPAAPTTFGESLQQAGAGKPLSPVPVAPGSPGVLGSLGNWVKDDKTGMVGYGLIQASGSLVSGLFNPMTTPQIQALEAQAAANRAATSMTAAQVSNMSQALPVAKRAVAPNVTGAPAGGLINMPPPGSANTVTGTPA
jgi:hypothetical protein